MKEQYVGIDVAKRTLDLAIWPERAQRTFLNTEEGIGELTRYLLTVQPVLIVLEATGGFEMEAVRAIAAAELPVVVVNPRQVRDFARAAAILAKTDTIDAHAIARFAEAIKPEVPSSQDRRTGEAEGIGEQTTAARGDDHHGEESSHHCQPMDTARDRGPSLMAHRASCQDQWRDRHPPQGKPSLEGKGYPPTERPRGGSCGHLYAPLGTSGTGYAQQETDCRPRRGRPAQPG